MGNQSPWAQRRQGSLTKTKSFDNELKVPTMFEAQKIMSTANKRTTSVDALNKIKINPPEPTDAERKIRSRSPFNFFSKKDDQKSKAKQKIGGRAAETGMDGLMPPTIAISNASFRGLAPPYQTLSSSPTFGGPIERTGSNRRPTLPANMMSRRGSRVKIDTEILPDENNDMLDNTVLDLVDEYFYGVRIFPGQDPSHVFCGWVTPNFKHYDKTWDATKVRKTTLQVWAEDGHLSDFFDRQNSYIMNAGKLYAEVHEDGALQGSRTNQGMFVGCHVDTSTGMLTFTADGKPTKHKLRIEPGIKLFPAIIFEATSKECLQFELGRTPTTLPLSAAILKTSEKHLIPQCPPRLKVQSLQAYQWSRCPNQSLKPHALKLSDIRGWSMLCEDPVSQLVVHIPEEDRSIDILELIECERLLQFHAHTLGLYGALCFQGMSKK